MELVQWQHRSILELGKHLLALRKNDLWRKVYGDTDQSQTWTGFLIHEMKISRSHADRAVDYYEIVHKKLGIPSQDIQSADGETINRLLPAYKRGEVTDEQFKEYLPLKRNEIREALNPHEHEWAEPETIRRCTVQGCQAVSKH